MFQTRGGVRASRPQVNASTEIRSLSLPNPLALHFRLFFNIYYQGNKGDVNNNTIFQSPVFDGIDLVGDQNKAINNTIFNSEEAGVFVQGDKNDVIGNTINEAAVGVLKDASSTNTNVAGNKFYNTGANVLPPSGNAPIFQSLSAAAQGRSVSAAKP